MKITVTSTERIVTLNGVQARIWEGETSSGIPVHCFITRIGVDEKENRKQFEKELQECTPPSTAMQSYPISLII